MQTVKVVDQHNGVQVTEFRCVCSPAQVGGPHGSHVAPFQFDRQVDDMSIGSPLVFSGTKSGAELWWHYAFEPSPNNNQYVEIKHFDGTISRYEIVPGVLLHDSVAGLTGQWWRLKWTIDPYDNKTEYFYLAGRLDHVDYPNGLRESWNWSPSWIAGGTWAGCSGLEISYSDKVTSVVIPELTYYIAFENIGQNTHFAGKIRYFYAQPSRYIPDAQPGALYDTSTPVLAHVVTEFCYGSGVDSDAVVLLRRYRHAYQSPIVPETDSTKIRPVLETTYYASGANAGRVATHHLSQLGITTEYRYNDPTTLPVTYPFALPAGVSLETVRVENLENHTYYVKEFDPESEREYRHRSFPGLNGRPRAAEGSFGRPDAWPEPDEVRVDRIYDSTCVCQKPIRVEVKSVRGTTESAARVTRYEYDSITKLIRKVWTPNPSTAANQPAEVVTEYDYHSLPTLWSPRWIAEERSPDGVTTYAYADPLNRQVTNGTHGKMQGSVQRTFVAVRRQVTESTTATADVSDRLIYDILGNPALGALSYSGSPMAGGVRMATDGDGVNCYFGYDTSHGHLLSVTCQDQQTVYLRDLWGRLTSVVENAGSATHSVTWTIDQGAFGETYAATSSSAPVVATKNFFDFWGNLAVTLRANKASDGQAPHKQASAPASARSWIRSEMVWQQDQLFETRVDRRPLDEDDSAPFGGTNPLMGVTRFHHDGFRLEVTLPSGAVSEHIFDGYGTCFMSRMKDGASASQTIEISRTYTDDWLLPVTTAFGQPSGSNSTATSRWVHGVRNGAGALVSYTEPVAPAVAGYSGSLGGSLHEFDIDVMGRVVGARTSNGGTPLASKAFDYDQLGRLMKTSSQVLMGGAPTSTHWSATGFEAGKISQIEWSGATGTPVTYYDYDALGRVLEVRDDQPGGGNRERYDYFPNTVFVASVLRSLVGAATRQYETAYERDPFGRVTQAHVSDGLAAATIDSAYYYGSLGYVDRYVDPMQREQVFLADALGRGVEHVRVGSNSTIENLAVYVDTGMAAGRTKNTRFDGLGHATVAHRDFAGRPFLVQNPGADYGTEPTAADPNEPHSQFATYDELSQVSVLGDGDDGRTAFKYDGMGRLIVRELLTIQPAIATFNTKDVLNRDGLGRVVIAGMAGASNGSAAPGTPAVSNAAVAGEQFSLDSLGRIHGESYQFPFAVNILQVQSTYSGADPFRVGLTLQDGLSGGASQGISMEYLADSAGRLEHVKWNTSGAMTALADYTWMGGLRMSRSVTYGAGGSPAIGATTFDYDEYGRLSLIRDVVTPAGGGTAVETNKFQYEYDLASNLKKEIYAKVVGGRVGDRFKYDQFDRLSEAYMGVSSLLMSAPPAQDPVGYNATDTTTRRVHNLDAANNRDSVSLEQGGGGPASTTYVLDNEVPGPSTSNRYESAGVTIFEHDKRGNLTYDGQFYYRYDFLNRLQEVWRVKPADPAPVDLEVQTGTKFAVVEQTEALDDARKEVSDNVFDLMSRVPREHMDPTFRARLKATISGGVIRLGQGGGGCLPVRILPANLELYALYGYDAFNRRIVRVVIGVDTLLNTYDGWREVEESRLDFGNFQAQPVRQYVHGARLDEILSYRRRVQVGGVFSWETYYVQHGGQDTAARLVDSSGAVIEQYEYDSYGRATVYNAAGTEIGWGNSKGLPFLWKSVHFDGETGLLYMRNRYYSVTTGRFLSCDPLGVWGDGGNMGNEYAYAWNRPLVAGDPLGRQAGHVILITDFPPFSGGSANSSQTASNKLKDLLDKSGTPNYGPVTLPVEWDKSTQALEEAKKKAEAANPGAKVLVVSCGQSDRVNEPMHEHVGFNRRDGADEKQNVPGKGSTPQMNDGSKGAPSEKEAPANMKNLTAGAGIAGRRTQGPYICSSMTYKINGDGDGVFIHFPEDPKKFGDKVDKLADKLAQTHKTLVAWEMAELDKIVDKITKHK